MSDSPSQAPTENKDIVLRAQALEKGKLFWSEIIWKKISKTLKEEIKKLHKSTESKDDFSFELLTFLLYCAHVVEPKEYFNYSKLTVASSGIILWKHFREYADASQDPPQQFMSNIRKVQEELSKRVDGQTIRSSDAAALIREVRRLTDVLT